MLQGRHPLPAGVDALNVGHEHMVQPVAVPDDLRRPKGIVPELKIQVQDAPIVPIPSVGGLGHADGGAVGVGHPLHRLIGAALGVEHKIQAVGLPTDHHGVAAPS